MTDGSSREPSARVTVAVVAICGASHLRRCLDSLADQRDAPPFDVVVVHDPRLEGLDALAGSFPDARFVSNAGQRTPLDLASRAVHESTGEILVLTEDHCEADAGWLARLVGALAPGRAAVGGAVGLAPGAEATDRAFWFVDFFRYAPPVEAGPSPSLTVCNVAYRRADLEAIRPVWEALFHETAVHRALAERFGALWLVPDAVVTMRRRVRFGDAVVERYAFGRLFGATRSAFVGRARWLLYALFSPLLPPLLLARMARRALPEPGLRGGFVRSLPALVVLVVAWSVGEWWGYWTRRGPRSAEVAPEVDAPR